MDGNWLITGAASGIGRALAERVVRAGGRVVLADLDPVAGEAAAAALQKTSGTSQATFVLLDVRDRDQTSTLTGKQNNFYGSRNPINDYVYRF